MKFVLATCGALLLAGCGSGKGTEPPAPAEAGTGEIRLGMTPDEAAASAGIPDRTTNVAPGDGTLDILWTYLRNRHLVLKGSDGGPDRDFPKGCVLVFGHDGRRLTEVREPGIR